ncbi:MULTISPECIES: adenine deaminase C-terminal domain-containing protein [unclassified Frankia]|uniref:adenine deaminase C-terminal domain-containing protein n=1 Tax=unclassified Frankia TaxID=2632575 RepID=UPI001EF529B7|nr:MULTISPECIES: adenine deaminase C-terminal domain-containing protein [unclassified Frankia]
MIAERDRERARPASGPVLRSPDAAPVWMTPAGGTAHAEPSVRAVRFGTVAVSPQLAPTAGERERLRRVANGTQEADLAVRGGMVAVVQAGELRHRDLLIVGKFIAAVTRPGALRARRTLDASGRYLLPAYVDPGVRLEQTLLTPGELARLVVPRGTVTLLVDADLPAALCGPRGTRLVTASGTPVRLLARTSPAAGGASLPDAGMRLPPQAVPRIGPAEPPPPDAPAELAGAWQIADIAEHGHLDRMVHRMVEAGAEPMTAIRAVTLGPARRYGLEHLLGSLAPARLADVQIVTDIAGPRPPEIVLASGRMAAERGRPLFDNLDAVPEWSRERMALPAGLHSGSFTAAAATAATAGMVDGVQVSAAAGSAPDIQIIQVRPARTGDGTGQVVADPGHDVIKIAMIARQADRAAATRVGFIRGVGLRQGAIAMTTSVAPGDLAIIGVTDQDMMTAARALEGMCGGFVVVDRGWVLAACPLPVAGLLSDAPWEAVRDQLAGVDAAAAVLGCTLPSPFLTLAPLGRRLCRDLLCRP